MAPTPVSLEVDEFELGPQMFLYRASWVSWPAAFSSGGGTAAEATAEGIAEGTAGGVAEGTVERIAKGSAKGISR